VAGSPGQDPVHRIIGTSGWRATKGKAVSFRRQDSFPIWPSA
jgi:hypothetical protein